MKRKYVESIVKHYESCLEKHGDSHKGVDWPNLQDAHLRYRVMLGVAEFSPSPKENEIVSLLDFGCGAAHLLDFMEKEKTYAQIKYSGLDISEKYVALSRKKHPGHTFYQGDILLDGELELPNFDFIVFNGVFTEKREMSFQEMWDYLQAVLANAFLHTNTGIAFNVMSKAVDWEREDLFHLPTDLLIDFLTKKLSRHFIIRNDYGLYEYTVYVYKSAHHETRDQ